MATTTTVQYIVKMQDKMSPVLKKVNASVKSTRQNIKGFANQINSLSGLGVGLSLAGIGAISNSLVNIASDAEETASKFGVVFASVGGEAAKVAQDLRDNYGLSSRASQQLLSDTGDLLSGFGFTGKMALGLSEDVNKLAVDLASFTNFAGGAEGASQALTKALLGERESVKSLGIAILESDVKARVKQLESMGKLIGMTMRQKKAFATLSIAQEQSKNAIGDFARTQDSFANKARVMRARMEEVRISLGQALLPIWSKAVEILTKLANWIKKNEEAFKKIVKTLVIVVGVIGSIIIVIKTWIAVQTVINFLLTANPIGLVIVAIGALIGLVIVVTQKYEKWGAAMTLLMGPLGMIINMVMVFRNNWEAIKKAFRAGGIRAGLIAIGKTMLDVLLVPVQQLLQLIGKIPGLDIVGDGAKKIEEFRKKFTILESDVLDANKSVKKEAGKGLFSIPKPATPVPAIAAAGVGESVVKAGGIKSFNLNIQKLTGIETIETTNMDGIPQKTGNLVLQEILKALSDIDQR